MIVNLTPHAINITGWGSIPASGQVARVSSTHVCVAHTVEGIPVFSAGFGEVVGLPDPKPGTLFLVSGMVAAAAKRPDVVAPATGHPDVIRANGQIVSVPGFSRG